MVIKISFVFT